MISTTLKAGEKVRIRRLRSWGICEVLKKEIDCSCEKDINKNTRLQMLMRYEEVDCGPLPPKNLFDK